MRLMLVLLTCIVNALMGSVDERMRGAWASLVCIP